jgi:hypothetical protein
MTKTVIVLSNASAIKTTGPSPADIAGLINAGQDKTFNVTDLAGVEHFLVVSNIVEAFLESTP